jgi:hypothetical protein
MPVNSNILYFSPHGKIPRALLLTRQRVCEEFPEFQIATFKSEPDSGTNHPSWRLCIGSLVSIYEVKEFLSKHWTYQRISCEFISGQSLFIILPDEFEAVLARLVISTPEVINCIEPGTLRHITSLIWTCYLPGENVASKIHVEYEHLPHAMQSQISIDSESSWMSLVMASENMIAIGGFVVSPRLIESAIVAKKLLVNDSIPTLHPSDSNLQRNDPRELNHSVDECQVENKSFYVQIIAPDYY